MIETRIGSIFEQPDVTILLQQCNLFHTQSAGIAALIKKKFPYAYTADCATGKGDESKLGSFSVGKPDSKTATPSEPFVVNLYSQIGIGGQTRNTQYDAMVVGLEKLECTLSGVANKYVLGIPYGIGSCLGGGDWTIVSAIIRSIFAESAVKVVIVRLPNQALLGEDAKTSIVVTAPVSQDDEF